MAVPDPKQVFYNDTGWLKYGKDWDDEGLQTYFDEPIIKVRFWNSKPSDIDQDTYDVVLLSELSKEDKNKYHQNKYNEEVKNIGNCLSNLPGMTIKEKKALTLILDYLNEELKEVQDFKEKGEPETQLEKSVKILINYLGVQK